MIRTFADAETERIWNGGRSRKLPPEIQVRARKMLRVLNAAEVLSDLSHPGYRRHSLKGDRDEQHSISINMHWRICFVWHDGGADGVEITDYH